MDHAEFIRDIPDSSVAVLMIHGIAGTPAHFRDLLPLIPESWTVHNIVLDGHGGSVADFAATSMDAWRSQAVREVERLLYRHEKLILIAHSMGTLFSIQAAIRHPERIPFLFLLNVPTRPWVRFSTLLTSLRVSRGNLRENDTAGWAMKNATCIRLERGIWKYAGWIPRLVELLGEISRTRKLLPQLRVPALAFQSRVDELVSVRSCRDLAGHPCINMTILEDSGHFQYGPEDTKRLQAALKQQLERIRL